MSVLGAATYHTASKLFTLVYLIVLACPLQAAVCLDGKNLTYPIHCSVFSARNGKYPLRKSQSVFILKLSEQNELYAKC